MWSVVRVMRWRCSRRSGNIRGTQKIPTRGPRVSEDYQVLRRRGRHPSDVFNPVSGGELSGSLRSRHFAW